MIPRSNDDMRFNRVSRRGQRIYLNEYLNGRKTGNYRYEGYIKCKLVHHYDYSLVLPDQIYVYFGGQLNWFQPMYYSGSLISNYEYQGSCRLSIDISHCIVLNIEFIGRNAIAHLQDGSIIYRCEIKAPKLLHRYTTGKAKFIDNRLYLRLYHHTRREAKESIIKGSEYWSSDWNIRGTKKLTNISYLYLTSLPAIEVDEDLAVIAMSSNGLLGFRIDQNGMAKPDLILTVYRESTTNRTETLYHWVEASLLATQPAYRHQHPSGFGYHQVVCPFIHRLGVEKGTIIKILDTRLIPVSPKSFDYAIVGSATTVSGLAAPYDEEETNEIFKIEYIGTEHDITSFWIGNTNSDQFSGKSVEMAEFSRTS